MCRKWNNEGIAITMKKSSTSVASSCIKEVDSLFCPAYNSPQFRSIKSAFTSSIPGTLRAYHAATNGHAFAISNIWTQSHVLHRGCTYADVVQKNNTSVHRILLHYRRKCFCSAFPGWGDSRGRVRPPRWPPRPSSLSSSSSSSYSLLEGWGREIWV